MADNLKKSVQELTSQKDFNDAIGNGVVLVDAYAQWCGPCKAISPLLDKWVSEKEFEGVKFTKFDIDKMPDVAQELGVTSIPNFFIFKDGDKVGSVLGARPAVLRSTILQHAPKEEASSD